MKIKRLAQSFKEAGRGIIYVFKNEQNFRLQTYAGSLVLLLAWFFSLSRNELTVILLLVFAVLILELVNSSLEKFADILKPRLSYQIQVVKEIMAAMVFVASWGAIIIGLLIFWPHLFEFFSQW